MGKTPKSKLEATKRYHQKLDSVAIRVPKGKREVYKKFAESKGKSLRRYIMDLIEADIQKGKIREDKINGKQI